MLSWLRVVGYLCSEYTCNPWEFVFRNEKYLLNLISILNFDHLFGSQGGPNLPFNPHRKSGLFRTLLC